MASLSEPTNPRAFNSYVRIASLGSARDCFNNPMNKILNQAVDQTNLDLYQIGLDQLEEVSGDNFLRTPIRSQADATKHIFHLAAIAKGGEVVRNDRISSIRIDNLFYDISDIGSLRISPNGFKRAQNRATHNGVRFDWDKGKLRPELVKLTIQDLLIELAFHLGAARDISSGWITSKSKRIAADARLVGENWVSEDGQISLRQIREELYRLMSTFNKLVIMTQTQKYFPLDCSILNSPKV